MIEKTIATITTDIGEIRQLYESAFPAEEQIPWTDLMQLVVSMSLDFTAYYNEDGLLLGFTVVYPRKPFNWFWYFAVPGDLRGKGVGQEILTRLIAKYENSTNILDMESPEQVCPNLSQRRRRHSFYLRNGFRDTGVGRSFEGIDYIIMMRGEGTFTLQDYDDVLNELRSFWSAMPNAENNSIEPKNN